MSLYLYPILSAAGALLVLVGEVIKSDKVQPGATDWPKAMVLAGGILVIIVALLSAMETGKQQGRLETLAGETKDLVTGGDSIVWVRLAERAGKPNTFRGDLVHTGDVVPAFDIDIEIIETGRCDTLQSWTMGQALISGVGNPRVQFVPAFGPRTLKTLQANFEPSCDDAYYLICIQSRTGHSSNKFC